MKATVPPYVSLYNGKPVFISMYWVCMLHHEFCYPKSPDCLLSVCNHHLSVPKFSKHIKYLGESFMCYFSGKLVRM